MPIYEYLCPNCNLEFELTRLFSEDKKTAICPKCKSEGQKLISGFACKTGGSIQASPKPFRVEITESVWKQARKDAREKSMGSKGRKNTKKPKQDKGKKPEAAKK